MAQGAISEMSRKITKEACVALLSGKPYKKDNTEVRSIGGGAWVMKLFGNTIANCHPFPAKSWGYPQSLRICDGRHQSKTTKERLNALPNVSIHQENFQWYINDCKWEDAYVNPSNPYGWIDVIVDCEYIKFKKSIPPVVIKQIKYSAKTYEELRKQYRYKYGEDNK